MAPVNEENQLELFDLASQPAPRPHRELIGHVRLHLRYDQLVLTSMAAVIGLTVIFACGVARGKQLARAEGPAPMPKSSARATAQDDALPAHSTSAFEPAPAIPTAQESPAVVKFAPLRAPSSGAAPKTKTPGKPVPVRSRYAVQVVSFNRPQLAKLEMNRLQSRGERAFLVAREGRMVVYVGPFPSKGPASEKVSRLRPRYQDCFVRML